MGPTHQCCSIVSHICVHTAQEVVARKQLLNAIVKVALPACVPAEVDHWSLKKAARWLCNMSGAPEYVYICIYIHVIPQSTSHPGLQSGEWPLRRATSNPFSQAAVELLLASAEELDNKQMYSIGFNCIQLIHTQSAGLSMHLSERIGTLRA